MLDDNIMEDKYIELLLCSCLNVNKNKSLFISYDKINSNFVNKLVIKAKKEGYTDIYLDETDILKRREVLNNLSVNDIDNHPYFNKNYWNDYAIKGANFLMLHTEFPNILNEVDKEKIARASYIERKTKDIFRKKEIEYEIPWCIAALPNEIWAKDLFPNNPNAYKILLNYIFQMCMIDTENPQKSWENYLENLKIKQDLLNNLKITRLNYKNNLGTNLTIELPNNYIWMSAADHIKEHILVNMPSYEIFTTPNLYKTNGIVYASKPLIYGGSIIENFYLKFENGKVIDFNAETGYETLKSIINSDNFSSYLGEVALVNYDSPISNTNLIFKTTLFDENASCHLALGCGFKKCILNSENYTDEEFIKLGVNPSDNHVDFMIGTDDLEIIAETNQGKVTIFSNGNFSI